MADRQGPSLPPMGSMATLLPLCHPTGGANLNLGVQGPSSQGQESLGLSCVLPAQGREQAALALPSQGVGHVPVLTPARTLGKHPTGPDPANTHPPSLNPGRGFPRGAKKRSHRSQGAEGSGCRAGRCSRDAMHAACMWSRDAEVIMLWEGEAGAVCGMEGGHTQPGAARRSLPEACSDTPCCDSVA